VSHTRKCNYSLTSHVSLHSKDRPANPEGPLEASDITASSIRLTWNPPKDNGGARIDKYILEKRVKGGQRWQKVPGLIKDTEATARNLEEGVEYEFRVMAVNDHGESEPLMTAAPIEARHPFGEWTACVVVFVNIYMYNSVYL